MQNRIASQQLGRAAICLFVASLLAGCSLDLRSLSLEDVQARDVGVGACEDSRLGIVLTEAELDEGWQLTAKLQNLGDGRVSLMSNGGLLEFELSSEPDETAAIWMGRPPDESTIRIQPGDEIIVHLSERIRNGADFNRDGNWTNLIIDYSYHHRDNERLYSFHCDLRGDGLPDAILRKT